MTNYWDAETIMLNFFETIPTLDLIALVGLFAAYYLYYPLTDYILGDDISAQMRSWRHQWSREIQWREERITDISLVRGLVDGISFFASTSVLMISGLVALLGAADPMSDLFHRYPYFADTTPEQIAIKIIALIILAISAFFKFGWSMRLHSYSTLMIGALPASHLRDLEYANEISQRIADMSFLASKHYHAGMRAYYLGFAALTWFISVWIFFATLFWIVMVMIRRDYMSKAFGLAKTLPTRKTTND